MQLRKRKPVNYSDDHALFSKFLSESEGTESSDSELFSMGNVNAHGTRKEESGALSEGDVEGASRSWGSFHLRSVIGGRRGQNSNQDGGVCAETSRLAIDTSGSANVLVRRGVHDLPIPTDELNKGSDSDDMVKLSRKRKVEDSPQTVQGWERSARNISFREAYSCDTNDYIRDKIDARTVPRAHDDKEASSSDEGFDPSSYDFDPKARRKPADTSLDRLLEDLSTVNVANRIGSDYDPIRETSDTEDMFDMCDISAVNRERKPQNSHHAEAKTKEDPLQDVNKSIHPIDEEQEILKGDLSPVKRLRRIQQGSRMKQIMHDQKMKDAEFLEYHQLQDFECKVTNGKQTVRGKEIYQESTYNIKAETPSDSHNHDEDSNHECRAVNKDESKPLLVRCIRRVEKILSVKNRTRGPDAIFSVKESEKCYRQVVSVKGSVLQKHCPQLLRLFLKRMDQLGRKDGHVLDNKDSPDFAPIYTRVDRIIAADQRGCSKYYLVKWCGLPYNEVTWEREENLQQDIPAICCFHKNNLRISTIRRVDASAQLVFHDGRKLRDYQEEGVAWLDHNFKNRTNCILADEMGLGKTIQSVAMIETLRMKRRIRGPFLVVAPVSTLAHWQRELESLTDMNCVVYTGNQEDRQIIRNHEFYYPDGNTCDLKFNVLLTSFEILMKDQNKLAKETWQYVVVDEAHRLKSRESKTAQSLRQLRVRNGGLLLLTGTPVQNNTKEIFSLLNLLDADEFGSEEEFLTKYGDIKAAEQIKDLQDNVLRPRLLRRMKEDVEKSIPLKEETIVWVELTREQRTFYRAIYENSIATLLKGSTSNNIPNLRNVAMELRKLCNHPFLCDGLEENIISKHRALHDGSTSDLVEKLLSQRSGKMVLVDKLLPKLKEAGRRVLIFSQFTMMLDLLEDYLLAKGYSYERIDGKVRGTERQAAIDRYSAKDSNIFVFLLSTRAGGLGITLTAADTCIIYDSDWNPQTDLQAMARCHRIGQTKEVKIYRLITRNTYEQRLFECSSRKYGLDEAILGNRMGVDVNQDHNKNIESLLKHGAYDMLKVDLEVERQHFMTYLTLLQDDGEAASEFSSQNIDQILEQRTQQRQIGGRANNTFSVATFISNPDIASQESSHDTDFGSTASWQELLPEACEKAVMEAMASKAPALTLSGGLRKRTRSGVDYKDMDVSVDNSSEEANASRKVRRSSKSDPIRGGSTDGEECRGSPKGVKQWSDQELKRLEDRFFTLGRGRTQEVMMEARLNHHSLEEVEEVSEALFQLCRYMQFCNDAESCQSAPSASGNMALNGTSTIAISRSEQRKLQRSKIMTPPTESTDHGLIKQPWNSGNETRSKRSVLGRAGSRLLVTRSEAEPRGEDHQMDTAEERLEKTQSEPPVVPAFVLKAMQSLEFQERLQKEASRYLNLLQDRHILADALQTQSEDFPPRVAFRSKKLPDWWGKQEDADLLRAAHLYGHKIFKKLKSDTSLCFVPRIKASAGDKSVNSKSRAKDKHGPTPGKKREEMPSDSVLASRLKKLMEALRNEVYLEAKAEGAETSRRKSGDLQHSRNGTRKTESGEPFGSWGPPSSSKQLSMTKILTASLAEKKMDKGKGVTLRALDSPRVTGSPHSVATSKAKCYSPVLRGEWKRSRLLVLKKRQTFTSPPSLKTPRSDDLPFKVPKDKKQETSGVF